jgi:hypothetical protein
MLAGMRSRFEAAGSALLAAVAISCSEPTAKPPVVDVSALSSAPVDACSGCGEDGGSLDDGGDASPEESLDGGLDAQGGPAEGSARWARWAGWPVPPAQRSPNAMASCEAECREESDHCNRGCPRGEQGRGCLRRCGCARVSCFSGCRSDGTAEFRCR